MASPGIFIKCIEVVLRNEGGYTWHESDPGGETNMGICKLYYPHLDIKNLTIEEAMDIYFEDYWRKLNLIHLKEDELILHIFDFGVNAGITRSAKMAQRIADVPEDGIIGPISTYFINKQGPSMVEKFKDARRDYYISLAERKPSMKVFLKGWLNRVNNTKF